MIQKLCFALFQQPPAEMLVFLFCFFVCLWVNVFVLDFPHVQKVTQARWYQRVEQHLDGDGITDF